MLSCNHRRLINHEYVFEHTYIWMYVLRDITCAITEISKCTQTWSPVVSCHCQLTPTADRCCSANFPYLKAWRFFLAHFSGLLHDCPWPNFQLLVRRVGIQLKKWKRKEEKKREVKFSDPVRHSSRKAEARSCDPGPHAARPGLPMGTPQDRVPWASAVGAWFLQGQRRWDQQGHHSTEPCTSPVKEERPALRSMCARGRGGEHGWVSASTEAAWVTGKTAS